MDNKAKMTGTVVLKHFKLAERLGTGAFGEIYKARDISKPEEVYAAKIEELNAKHPQLYFEAKLYRLLNTIQPTKGEKNQKEDKDRGIPKIYAMSTEGPYNIMLMDLLGKSLEDLFVANNKRFSLKTVVLIADQLLERIEYIHSREFLHRDIKPDNFLIGEGKKADKIYMIDLGLAKKYVKDGKHIPYKEGKELTGTARYASINTHMGIQQSRRDDIESIGYVLIYFLKGILPWQNMKGKDTKTKYENIKDKKQSTPVDVLCSDCPPQFKAYLEYAKSLKFEDKPDYSRLRKLFLKVREDKNYTDEKFDWSVEKLIEQKPITYIPQNKLKDPINVEETNGKVEKLEVFEPLKPKKSQEAPFEKTNQSNKAMNFSKTQTKTGSEKPSLFQIPKVPAPKISMINR